MTATTSFLRATLAGAVFSMAIAAEAPAAPGDVFVEVMASPTGIFPGATPGTSGTFEVGHAFACMVYHLSSGIKEDCYGFYPTTAQQQAKIVGTNLVNEFKVDKVNRFSAITVSVKRKVTDAERKAFIKAIDTWNGKSWKLNGPNCADFVHHAAGAAGFKQADRATVQTPSQYVEKLKALNP